LKGFLPPFLSLHGQRSTLVFVFPSSLSARRGSSHLARDPAGFSQLPNVFSHPNGSQSSLSPPPFPVYNPCLGPFWSCFSPMPPPNLLLFSMSIPLFFFRRFLRIPFLVCLEGRRGRSFQDREKPHEQRVYTPCITCLWYFLPLCECSNGPGLSPSSESSEFPNFPAPKLKRC